MNATSENSLAEFERLLKETSNLLESRRGNMKTNIERLLAESKPHLERIKSNEELTASRFNVFDALGVVRKEVIQSRFLAYLFSPSEQHKQGAKFLNAFLEKIEEKPIESDFAQVKVFPEYSVGKYGRMDIVITTPNLLVIIENKVDASEGDEQLKRYQDWMGLEENNQSQKKLVFLTPNGDKPKTHDTASEIEPFPLSYAELAEIFSPLILTIIPCSVRAVIEQYITACRLITFGEIAMTTLDKDLIALLTKPDNLTSALEIEQQMARIRKDITIKFRDQIVKVLEIKLEEIDWRVKAGLWGDYNILIWTSRDNGIRNPTTYYFKVEDIFYAGGTGRGRYLWCRPNARGSEANEEIRSLTDKMINDAWIIEKNDNSIFGYQLLQAGRNGFNSLDNSQILQCNEDNQKNDHPHATKIAEEIWGLFETCRPNIERLPSFQAANA